MCWFQGTRTIVEGRPLLTDPWQRRRLTGYSVMAGLVPGLVPRIHVFALCEDNGDVDGRAPARLRASFDARCPAVTKSNHASFKVGTSSPAPGRPCSIGSEGIGICTMLAAATGECGANVFDPLELCNANAFAPDL